MTLLDDITGTVGTTSTEVTLTAGHVKAFYLTNTHASQVLYWSGGTASTSSARIEAGKAVYVPATITTLAGPSLYGSAAGTTYTITPLG